MWKSSQANRQAACFSLALIAILLGVAVTAPLASAGITDAVKSETLPNGLLVLVLENHKAPVATLNIFYKVGSRNEQFGRTGLSHLVEHLMFRGTKKLKPEEFSNRIQENGGMDNAFTNADFTDYFEVINKNHLDVPIALEADRMDNFEPKGFDSEKAVVIEERRLRTEDSPQDALAELTQAQAFVEHPYHWPVIGWMQDLRRLSLEDALAYHRMYYSPQNAIVVAVGDFDANKVLKQIGESFGAIRNGPQPIPVAEVEPPQAGQRHATLKHAANLPAFSVSFHVPNYRNKADSYALDIAAVILAGGKSSRLYKKLVVEKRMVVGVDVGYERTSFDPGLFTVAAQMRPGIKTADTLEVLRAELGRIKEKAVSDQELRKAKNQVQADFVFGQDSIFSEALQLGLYQMLGDYKMLDEYIPGIEKVTNADIQRVAKQYLDDSNRTEGILVPTGMLPHPAGGPSGGTVHHSAQSGELP